MSLQVIHSYRQNRLILLSGGASSESFTLAGKSQSLSIIKYHHSTLAKFSWTGSLYIFP